MNCWLCVAVGRSVGAGSGSGLSENPDLQTITLEVVTGTPLLGSEIICVVPIALQEMAMALWLIIKGFNPKALAPEAKGD